MNKKLDSDFREIDCTSEKNNLLSSAFFANITDNQNLVGKAKPMETLCQVQKNICGNTVEDVQKIGKSTLDKKDEKVVRNESIDLESIYARLAEASSFSEDPASPPHLHY